MSQNVQVIELHQGEEYQPLLEGTPQTCGMRSGQVYLNPGQECGEHTTGAHEEMLVFLAGHGKSFVGEDKKAVAVGKGKVLYIPPYTLHNICNSETEPLVYIYCVAPIGQSEQKNE